MEIARKFRESTPLILLNCWIFFLFGGPGYTFAIPPPVQSDDLAQESPPVFRATAQLILTRFHLIKDNVYVQDLTRDQVQVYQDGKRQDFQLFEGPSSTQRSLPIDVYVLLDVSHSTVRQGFLDGTTLAQTVLGGLDSNARISVWAFAEDLKRFSPLTRDTAVLDQALKEAYKFEHLWTHLYEAIVNVCNTASEGDPNVLRAMIVFSDGFETGSDDSGDAFNAARDADISIFPVVLGHERLLEGARFSQNQLPSRTAPGRGIQTGAQFNQKERRLQRFAELGERTGGRSFDPKELNGQTMKTILQIVSWNLRSQYVVGYYGDPNLEKGKHKVEVKLANKSLGKLDGGKKEFRN